MVVCLSDRKDNYVVPMIRVHYATENHHVFLSGIEMFLFLRWLSIKHQFN